MDSEWVEIRTGNPTEKNAREYIAELEKELSGVKEDNKRLREELKMIRNKIMVHY